MSRRLQFHLLERTEIRPVPTGLWDHPPTDETEDREFKIAVCGEESSYDSRSYLTEARHVTCPACHQKLAKAALKARGADEPKLTLVQDKAAKGGFRYQGGWRALVDGEHVAYLGFEDHYWRIYRLGLNDKRDLVVGSPMNDDGTAGERTHTYHRVEAARYKSKESALLVVGDLRASKHLHTFQELLDGRKRAEQAWVQRRARIDAQHAEEEEARNDTLRALKELHARDDLTNFQRAGLLTAIAHYEKPIAHPLKVDVS